MESFMAPTSWWSSGLLKEEGTFKEGNGALFTEGEYVNGQLNGMFREWAEDGLLLMSATVKDGEFDGPFKSWWSSGLPKEEGTYRAGKRIGRYTWYDTDGSVWRSSSIVRE